MALSLPWKLPRRQMRQGGTLAEMDQNQLSWRKASFKSKTLKSSCSLLTPPSHKSSSEEELQSVCEYRESGPGAELGNGHLREAGPAGMKAVTPGGQWIRPESMLTSHPAYGPASWRVLHVDSPPGPAHELL